MKNLFTLDVFFDEEKERVGMRIKGEAPAQAVIPMAICRLSLELSGEDSLERGMRKTLAKAVKNKEIALEVMVMFAQAIRRAEMVIAEKEGAPCRHAN